MIFHGRFRTKQDGLSTDSLRRLKRSTTKRNVASDRQLVSEEEEEENAGSNKVPLPFRRLKLQRCASPSPSSMSSSALLCPSAMATLPLITGLAGILGGSSVSPAARKRNSINVKALWKSGQKIKWNSIQCCKPHVKPQGRCVVYTSKTMPHYSSVCKYGHFQNYARLTAFHVKKEKARSEDDRFPRQITRRLHARPHLSITHSCARRRA